MSNRTLLPIWYAARAARITDRRARQAIRARRLRRHAEAYALAQITRPYTFPYLAADRLERRPPAVVAIIARRAARRLSSHTWLHGAPPLALAAQIAARKVA